MAGSQNGHVKVVDKLLLYGARVDLQRKVSRNPRDNNMINLDIL